MTYAEENKAIRDALLAMNDNVLVRLYPRECAQLLREKLTRNRLDEIRQECMEMCHVLSREILHGRIESEKVKVVRDRLLSIGTEEG